MKSNKDVAILIFCLTLFLLNQYYLKTLGIQFFNNHLNDLLAIPLYFSAFNLVFLYLLDIEINSFKILFAMTVVLSFMGEYVSLFVREGSVFDYLDIICYFIGFLAYYIIKNYPKKSSE